MPPVHPTFCAVAKLTAICQRGMTHVDRKDDVDAALQALLAADGPALLHVAIDTAANVWPLVPPNHNNAQMMDPDDAGTLDTGAPASPSTATATSTSQEPRNALSA